jgi:hypothetical protein
VLRHRTTSRWAVAAEQQGAAAWDDFTAGGCASRLLHGGWRMAGIFDGFAVCVNECSIH